MSTDSKQRIPIPLEVAAEALFQQDHTCCVCRERGQPVQIHHIDEDSSNNALENLAVLCLSDHERTQIRGGFGRKLLAGEVIKYRDDWLRRVELRRTEADRLATTIMAGAAAPATSRDDASRASTPSRSALLAYVEGLPTILASAYGKAQPLWDTGVTAQMLQGNYDVIDVVEQIWVHLAIWFPPNHFGQPADKYFSEYVSQRFGWHRALMEPEGPGTGGTIIGVMAGAHVLHDLEVAIEETVHGLLDDVETFSYRNWQSRWRGASRK